MKLRRMKRIALGWGFLGLLVTGISPALGAGMNNPFRYRSPTSPPKMDWVVSGGLGLTFGPTLVLFNPQLEYIHDERLSYGPMIQAAVGNATLVTFSGTARYKLGNHPQLKPNAEAGFGLAVGSNYYTDNVGVHIMVGMGADWVIDNWISAGTSVRVNFAPPLKTVFVSWPIAIVRFHL